MAKYLPFLAFVALPLWTFPAAAVEPAEEAPAFTVEQIVERLRPSLVTIRVDGRDGGQTGMGTGFVVAENLIATNLHVIGEGRAFSLETSDQRKLKAVAIEASDQNTDLAVVRIEPAETPLPVLPLGEQQQVKQGMPVVVMGNPWGLRESVVNGVVSAIREVDGRDLIQLAMPIEPGNSGSPMVDLRGQVLGIVNMKSAVQQRVAFAIQVGDLKRLLERPNPVPIDRWVTIGAMDPQEWKSKFGARWRQQGGVIQVSGAGAGFGGRALCLYQPAAPEIPYEVQVAVKLEDEAGAAGLVFHSDGEHQHYGFYPSQGRLRLTCFRGPTVFSWQVLHEETHDAYRPGTWNYLKVRIEQDRLLCYVNDRPVFESADASFRSGRLGLAKFRDTVAAFKHFQVAAQLAPSQVAEDERSRVGELLDGIPRLSELTPADFDQLVASPRAAVSVLQDRVREFDRRARRLEAEAAELRQLSSDIRVRHVAHQLGALVRGEAAESQLIRGALLIAQLENPDVDLDAYLQQVRKMADEIRAACGEDADEQQRLAALDRYLFEENGYHGSRFEYYHRANSFMHRVIEDREGLPITLSVLYLELARQLGLELRGIGMPGHFVTQFVPKNDGPSQLIDVFDQGKRLSREDAARLVATRGGAPLKDEHLEPSTPREILTRMVMNLYRVVEKEADQEAMLKYLEALVAMEPDSFQYRGLRAVLRSETGRKTVALADMDWIIENAPPGVDVQRMRQMRQFFEQRD